MKLSCKSLKASYVEKEVPWLDQVYIVKKSTNFFLDDLIGWPSLRAVNFCNDLILTTSMTPYRMVAAKLRGLKEQLLVFLDK